MFDSRARGTRGAALVEYALVLALVLVGSLGAVSALEDDAGDRLDDRGTTIGAPGDEAVGGYGSSGGNPGGDDDGDAPPPDPPTPYTGAIGMTCTGSGSERNDCSFSLTIDPAPEVPSWTVNPFAHVDGTSPTFGATAQFRFTKDGTYTVRSQVGATEVLSTVACTEFGSGRGRYLVCAAA